MRARLNALLRSEQGIALPMAMIITVIAMGLAAVPIVASVSSQSGGTNNQRGNEALAAAEAGAELAVLRQSQLLVNTPDQFCYDAEEVSFDEGGWCPEVGRETIGQAEYSYKLRPCYRGDTSPGCIEVGEQAECTGEDEGAVQVVSTGFSNGVTKRVQVTGCASSSSDFTKLEAELIERLEEQSKVEEVMREEVKNGTSTEEVPGDVKYEDTVITVPPPNVFAKGQIVGIDSLNMHNDAQVYNGGAGSNGWVKMVGSANVCGSVSYGTTFSTDNSSSNKAPANCALGRTSGQGTAEYPPIDLPAGIKDNNSNSRLAAADPVGPNVWQRGNISWNASNRHLTVSYDQITLEGTLPYFLCQLTLAGGSKLLAGSGKSIKIYFDSPQNCKGLNGIAQLQIANGAYVGADAYSGPGFYFVGSTDPNSVSRVELGGGANVSQFVVYAPYSQIVANNGVNLRGAIIGRTLDLGGGAKINPLGPYTPPPVGDFIDSTTEPGPPKPVPGEPKIVTSISYSENETRLETIEVRITEIRKLLEDEEGDQSSSLERSLFVECSAKPAPGDPDPDSGC